MTFSEKTYSNKTQLVDFSSEWCLPCMSKTQAFDEAPLNRQYDEQEISESPEPGTVPEIGSVREFSKPTMGKLAA